MHDILATNDSTQIISSRIFNYPVNTLFKAWSQPEYLKQWWGPKGFTNTFHKFDFREGGTWKFTMNGPEKGNYENEVVFIKIAPPHLIAWDRVTHPLFQIFATFIELAEDKTELKFEMKFYTEELRNKLINFVPEKNEENFDKLEMVLSLMSSD